MNVSIDQVWSVKEEPCRANNWKKDEVLALLNAIKTNNLIKGNPSKTQLGQLLEPLLGYSRTAFQITGKLKNLRKSYLTCKKKGCTAAALEECPYYELLAEIYANEEDHDSDTNYVTNDHGQNIEVSSEKGIETMFAIIEDLKLVPDLARQSFSPGTIRLITKMLIARGVCASTEQVKFVLIDLRKGYIQFRQNRQNDKTSLQIGKFEYLHSLWGSTSIPDLLNDTNVALTKQKTEASVAKDKGDYWSEEETIVLLTSIKAMDLTDEASKNTEEAAKKIKDSLKDSGYMRSKHQIQRRLDNLQNNYLNAQQAKSLEEAIKKFPFYALYESTFNSSDLNIPDFCTSDAIDELNARKHHEECVEDDSTLYTEKTKHSRSRTWSDDETILMLNLLTDLNLTHLIAHRLSFEIACKIVDPLCDQGYVRSAMQIQIKLRNLRKSYYRCVRAGSTEKAIAECPFYHKLNAIFKQPRASQLRTVRKLEHIDSNFINVSESFTDHSYSNATSTTDKFRKILKTERDESDEDSSEVWLPVETICNDSVDNAMSGHKEEEASDSEKVGETELHGSNYDDDALDNQDDPLEELLANREVDNDTGQINRAKKRRHEDSLYNENHRTYKYTSSESPGPSRKSTGQTNSSLPLRRSKRIATKPLSAKQNNDSSALKSMRIVMAEVLRHEKLLQRQHQVWMERQFEIQRKHDREQRELLINELKEFRKVVTSAKIQIPENLE